MTNMKDLILLGMRAQLKMRNDIIMECLIALGDIIPCGAVRIPNQYLFGDDQCIDPDAADAFMSRKFTASVDDVMLSMEVIEPDCCHSCCESGPCLEIRIKYGDNNGVGTYPLEHMWNWIMCMHDDQIQDYIADYIVDISANAHPSLKYAECKKIAHNLLNGIRQDVIITGCE